MKKEEEKKETSKRKQVEEIKKTTREKERRRSPTGKDASLATFSPATLVPKGASAGQNPEYRSIVQSIDIAVHSIEQSVLYLHIR